MNHDILREARMELVESAREHRRLRSYYDWLDNIAPQWALDAMPKRELDALFGMYWEKGWVA